MDDTETETDATERTLDSTESKVTGELITNPVHLHVPPRHPVGSRETGFHKSSRMCLKIIRDAMLRHNWPEAANYFISYVPTLEDTSASREAVSCEVIWRLCTEILHHLPNANTEDFNAVYEQMKHFGVRNYAKICLEHAFHLMMNGQWDEAKRQLSIADGWRYGKETAAQSMDIKLIRVYNGLLDYVIWCKKKSTTSATDDISSSSEVDGYFRQASVTLQEIIKQPGIWDPFVLSYINMLEFYKDEDGALKVLKNYAYNNDFPSNPNALVYLYQFLKKHNAPQSKLISSLRNLYALDPSHELMIDFCSLLLQNCRDKNLEEALRVSMDLLEFSSWKYDIKGWECLLSVIHQIRTVNLPDIIMKEWRVRKPLWLAMHYRPHVGRIDRLKGIRLLRIKQKVLRVMGKSNGKYFKVPVNRRNQTS